MIAPMALGLGGNAVTVSQRALGARWPSTAPATISIAAATGAALAAVIAERCRAADLRFAVVHPYSGHNYELRYWLAACGIDPDRDIEIVILPPPLMADALASGAHRRLLRRRAVEHARRSAAGAAISSPSRPRSGDRARKRCSASQGRWASDNPEALAALLARALPGRALVRRPGEPRGAGRAAGASPAYLGLPRGMDAAGADRRHLDSGGGRQCARRGLLRAACARRRRSRGRATHCGSTRRWSAGGRSPIRRRTTAIAARDLPARTSTARR